MSSGTSSAATKFCARCWRASSAGNSRTAWSIRECTGSTGPRGTGTRAGTKGISRIVFDFCRECSCANRRCGRSCIDHCADFAFRTSYNTVMYVLRAILLVLATTAPASQPTTKQSIDPNHELIIRHGKVLDGAGNDWFYADVLVRGDRIAAIGKIDPHAGAE